MSLRAQLVGNQAAQNHFPAAGGTTGGTGGTSKTRRRRRLSAEKRAEEARLNDPYGDHGGARGPEQRGRVRRRSVRVRRRRVGTQAKVAQQTTAGKSGQAKQGGQAGKAGGGWVHSGPSNQAESHMQRFHQQGNLNQMTAGFRSANSGRPSGPQSPVGQKMAMLGNLQKYMENDYNCMKANEGDKAFTYRTSEARQLCATLGTMVASANNKGKKDSKTEDRRPLTPAAFAKQKGLLRRLAMMSEPDGRLPEGLPPDYQPFESVA